ncbi:MAG: Lrp/AsnC family transcriptional regulator [Lachnospiraceae bacterium]|nr:Lrp/AsnC family transcriptional regulator [Lachnospiraceae bacterium]
MYIEGLDETDNKILEVIKRDARLSYSDIGKKVGLSRVAVKNRMDALEKKGVIEGYYTRINVAGYNEGRRFFMDIITEPEAFNEVVDTISKYEIIRRVYAVTGESRLRVEGLATSNMKYEMYMKSLKKNLKGVKSICIQDVQYTIKDVDGGVGYVRMDEREAEEAENNNE